jgi:ribonuclease HI
MKKKLLKQAASLRKSLKDYDQKLSDAFDLINEVILQLPEQSDDSSLDEKSFSVPMDLIGLENTYILYSDGACRGNPGPGAYGCLLQDSNANIIFEYAQTKELTTNNQMELQGVISGIDLIKEQKNIDLSQINLTVITDSKYVVDGISKWVAGWKKRGWKKSDNKAPENLGQWQALDILTQQFKTINFQWVKGHSGHPQNEYCDQLANKALDSEGY